MPVAVAALERISPSSPTTEHFTPLVPWSMARMASAVDSEPGTGLDRQIDLLDLPLLVDLLDEESVKGLSVGVHGQDG